MKYETTRAFNGDIRRLKRSGDYDLFAEAVRRYFIPAAEHRVADPSSSWPRRLRVKRVQGTAGVWEMTWNFKQPDGRATWEWIELDGEPAIRWRRVGSHSIFADP